jgi:hypothetical protein
LGLNNKLLKRREGGEGGSSKKVRKKLKKSSKKVRKKVRKKFENKVEKNVVIIYWA